MSLYELRNKSIINVLKCEIVSRVLDLGCGDGKLICLLQNEDKITKIGGVDISAKKINKLSQKYTGLEYVEFFHQSFLDYNEKFKEYEGFILSEVIEHLSIEDLLKLFDLIFFNYQPKILIITTPNRSYNFNYEILHNGLRHISHIYELSDSDVVTLINFLERKYFYYSFQHSYCNENQSSHMIISKRRF